MEFLILLKERQLFMNKSVLELSHIHKSFPYVDEILNDVCVNINRGESVALVGESGSGKSTLLQIAALLESPTSGNIIINGNVVNNMTDNEKTMIRRKNIGFVYQFHNLLPEFTSVENVMIPLILDGQNKKDATEKAITLLESIGLSHRLHQYPKKLSGGEQQRVAIARALSLTPDIIIADEPTGSLDNRTSHDVFEIFLDMIRLNGTSLLLATHNIDLSLQLQKQASIENGKLTMRTF